MIALVTKSFLVIITILILLSLVISPIKVAMAQSRTIVVPTDYPSIQQAINSANDGDTVIVKKGIYYETLFINKSITLIGENREQTIIDAQRSKGYLISFPLEGKDRVTFTNFTLGNTGKPTSSGQSPTGIFIAGDNLSIVNNTIVSTTYGVFFGYVTNSLIADNIFVDCGLPLNFIFFPNEIVNGIITINITNPGVLDSFNKQNNTISGNRVATFAEIPSPFISPNPTPTASPTPTVPEFAAIAIFPLFAVLVFTATLILRNKRLYKSL